VPDCPLNNSGPRPHKLSSGFETAHSGRYEGSFQKFRKTATEASQDGPPCQLREVSTERTENSEVKFMVTKANHGGLLDTHDAALEAEAAAVTKIRGMFGIFRRADDSAVKQNQPSTLHTEVGGSPAWIRTTIMRVLGRSNKLLIFQSSTSQESQKKWPTFTPLLHGSWPRRR
jgi:hypothetical protein